MPANAILASLLRSAMRFLPKRKNSTANNLATWDAHDWSRQGEEWSNTPEWKNSVLEHILRTQVPVDSRVLEIGPGAGRWTEHLIQRASHLIVVDLSPRCIELCKQRFQDARNIEFHVNDGRTLDFIADASIDRVWSWDVFVHIQSQDVREYVRHFSRILAPSGRAVIHHAKLGRNRVGWRSDMTAEKMRAYCREFKLDVLQQFESWDEGKYSIWPTLPGKQSPDIVTVFQKP